jgi:ankyrin repeat protein
MVALSSAFCAPCPGRAEAAKLLLSSGASVDIAYFHGTPLHIAAAYGKTGVIKVLLEHHADVIIKFHFLLQRLFSFQCDFTIM